MAGGLMSPIKVVITDHVEPDLEWETEQFEQLGIAFSHYQLKFGSAERILEVAADADVVITNMANIDAKVIDGLQRCKLIIRHGVGYDNVDIAAATRRRIVVANDPVYCIREVAEQTVMLMLACQRRLLRQRELLRNWVQDKRYASELIQPIYSMQGKTLGIIGFGRIGSTVYRLMQGFGVKFLVDDPYLSETRKREYGITTVSLEEVLRGSDIVTIHTPLNEETYHLLDERQFAMMKETAILINTARGGLVHLQALDKALRKGIIAHAGIDVYENEPPDQDSPLLHNENAICTPHSSWYSEDAGWIIRRNIVDDVLRFCQGRGPKYPVNPEVRIRVD
jgi:D-3-phosphoglycerate dehydrogenase